MVERAAGAKDGRLGLDRDQSRRRRRAHGVSNARERQRRQLLGGRRRAERRRPRAHPEAGRSPVRAADGRPGARRAREHRHRLLGRRDARGTRREGARAGLSRADRVLETAQALNACPLPIELRPRHLFRKTELPASPESSFVTVQGRKLEVRTIAGTRRDAPTLVFLHEGLGSVSMWRDFPEKAAQAAGCTAVVYSRYGHGQSEVLREPRAVDYMHAEALEALPEVLDKLGVDDPILVGHSDGGSIALLYAAARGGVRGLVLMAPHVFVEDISVKSIAEAKTAFETTDLPQKLGRYHADSKKTFRGWNDIWLHPDFRGWNIEEYLPRIHCPVLAIQGFDDEYGTMAQLTAIAKQTRGPVELLRLADCRHSPHRDQPGVVLEAMVRFIGRLGDGA